MDLGSAERVWLLAIGYWLLRDEPKASPATPRTSAAL
jgi:hypothetical protein